MQIISTLNVRFAGIIFQKVSPLGKCQSDANLQVHSSHQVHARATRFTSGNAQRPIRQWKKIFPFKQTFEIEFHLTKSKMKIWKVQVAWVPGTWAGTTFGHLRNWAIYLECRNRNLNGNIGAFECTNKSSFGWRGASGWLDRKFRILKAPGLQRKGLSCEAEIAGTPLGTNL